MPNQHRRKPHRRNLKPHKRNLKLRWLSLILIAMIAVGCGGPYSTVPALGPLVPHGVREGYTVRKFILENGEHLNKMTPQQAMDEIYFEALAETNGDKGAAYLATLIGVLEHRHIPLRILGIGIDIPLTFESDSIFQQRIGHLPKNIYGEGHDDRDKLQHFFANAWLKREIGMEWLVIFVGELIEVGEDAMVVGGVYDERDKIANRDGIRFAARSGDSLSARPSEYLTKLKDKKH